VRLGALYGLLLVLGAGELVGCKGREQAPAPPPQPEPISLGAEDVVRLEPRVLQSGPTLSGTLQPRRVASVRAEVPGTVLEMRAEQGQPVREGQLLARIEDTTQKDQLLAAQSAERVAESALKVARAEEERMRKLSQAGVITKRDFEQAELARRQVQAQLSEAEARRALAQEQLGRTRITAPFKGVVSERNASAGDIVQPGAPLYTVVDPTSLRLEASLPAVQLESLSTGTEVDFTVSGYGERTFAGRIERINPTVDPATGQVRIYVTLPNLEQSLLSGLFAQGRVASEEREVLAAPLSAVDVSAEPPTVMRVRDNTVERVPVTLGMRDEVAGLVELREGVNPGDVLLRGSARELSEGTPVTLRAQPAPAREQPGVGGGGSPEDGPSAPEYR
jgi:RND family efflux transporter MFP subunit